MRVYRGKYSVPRPPGSKLLKRKDGDYCRFTTRRGEEVVAKLTKSGKRVQMETTAYSIEFKDHHDILRRLTAFTSEDASQRVARTLEDLLASKGSGGHIDNDLRRRLEGLPPSMRKELAEWGLLDSGANMATKPLPELAELYIQSLRAAERSKDHVRGTEKMLLTLFKECGFQRLSDIDADRLAAYLKSRREGGISHRRSNAFLMAAKCFVNWCVERDLLVKSPLKPLKLLDVQKDRRRVRRALELDELKLLFASTQASETVHHNLTGAERALVYRVAAETGMRRGEMRKLTVGCIDFDCMTITLPANVTKAGRERTVPLTPQTAADLRQALQNKLPTARAFKLPYRTARMLQWDLEAVGLPYTDDQGHVFDFHALRGECASLLIEGGVDPKTVQEILGHSDIRLTLDLYAKVLGAKAKKEAARAAVAKTLYEKAG